jgi:diguanylate cyclase (GGDEF)-like protein
MSPSPLTSDLEQVLRERHRLQRIPLALEEKYLARRHEEFARLVALWSPLLLLAYAGCLVFTAVFYGQYITGGDLRTYLVAESLAVSAGGAGLLLARRPAWKNRFDAWIPWFFGLIVFIKVIAGFLIREPLLAINQVYITLVVVIIGMLALQLSLKAALVGAMIGGSAFLLAPWLAEAKYAWLFLGHYVLTGGVCLFVALILEDKDREAFLQSMLFALERQEVQRLNVELDELARRDALTHLPNRRHFDEVLLREWDRASRTGNALCLLLVDVDHFKAYNDHLGHLAGDACLAQVASAMQSAIHRPADFIARYGGEEFAVLLPETSKEGACELARRLIERVDALALSHGMSPTAPHVSISVGGACTEGRSSPSIGALLTAADAALYKAKHAGRHRFHFHDGFQSASSS